MATQTIQTGFVIRDDGAVAVQIADDRSRWGFVLAELATDNQDETPTTFEGGFGWGANGQGWELVADDDPRLTAFDHERYDWLVVEARA